MAWLSLPELCRLLSITPEEWAQWCADGTAPHHEHDPAANLLGSCIRIHRADLAAWMDHYRTEHGSDVITTAEAEEIMRRWEQDRGWNAAGPPPLRHHDVWMSVLDICAELAIEPEEWQQWRTEGLTPPHLALPDGRTRVRRADVESWLDSLPEADLFAEGE